MQRAVTFEGIYSFVYNLFLNVVAPLVTRYVTGKQGSIVL